MDERDRKHRDDTEALALIAIAILLGIAVLLREIYLTLATGCML